MSRPVKPVRLTVTRYFDRYGRQCRKNAPGAKKHTEKTNGYYARLVDPRTGRKRPYDLDTTDLGQAWVALRNLLRRRADEAAGIVDDTTDQMARPIDEQVEEWLADVLAGGTDTKQVH